MLMPPTLADIETLAQAAVERLPDRFRTHLAHVILKVEDFPDETVMAEMELETEWDLLGLYWGRHVGMKGDVPTGALPDMIFLYRRPMLDVWVESGEALEVLVTHVLVPMRRWTRLRQRLGSRARQSLGLAATAGGRAAESVSGC
jgi:predicted Zn-dependent protease with MMP-like domain